MFLWIGMNSTSIIIDLLLRPIPNNIPVIFSEESLMHTESKQLSALVGQRNYSFNYGIIPASWKSPLRNYLYSDTSQIFWNTQAVREMFRLKFFNFPISVCAINNSSPNWQKQKKYILKTKMSFAFSPPTPKHLVFNLESKKRRECREVKIFNYKQ